MIVRERGQYMVNFGAFDAVYEHETLPYSAEDLDRLKNGEEPEEDVPSDADSAKSTKEPVSVSVIRLQLHFANDTIAEWYYYNRIRIQKPPFFLNSLQNVLKPWSGKVQYLQGFCKILALNTFLGRS